MTNESKTGTARKPVANLENNATTNQENKTMTTTTTKETANVAEFTTDQAQQIKLSVDTVTAAGVTYVKGIATLARTYKAVILQEMEKMTATGLSNRQAYKALLDVIKCSQAHLSKTCIDGGFPPCEEKSKDMQAVISGMRGLAKETVRLVTGGTVKTKAVPNGDDWEHVPKAFAALNADGQAKAFAAIEAYLAAIAAK